MMRTHYQVLEVSEQAASDEIRRAYRRLVLLTHPDRTPDPQAHAHYLAINEAYDTLIHPMRRRHYDAQLQAWRTPVRDAPAPASGRHRDPRRRSGTRPGFRPGPRTEPYAAEYARYAPLARRVYWVVIAFFGLLLDRSWIRHWPQETVLAREFHSFAGRNYSQTWYEIRTQHARFRSYNLQSTWPDVGQPLQVAQTALFNVVTGVYDPARPGSRARLSPPGFYNFFFLLPVAMALTAVFGVLPASPNKRRVDACVMAVLLGLLAILLLVFYQ